MEKQRNSYSAGLRIIFRSRCLDAIAALVQSQDPIVKVRALSLVTALASATPEAAAQIRSTGHLLLTLTFCALRFVLLGKGWS